MIIRLDNLTQALHSTEWLLIETIRRELPFPRYNHSVSVKRASEMNGFECIRRHKSMKKKLCCCIYSLRKQCILSRKAEIKAAFYVNSWRQH